MTIVVFVVTIVATTCACFSSFRALYRTLVLDGNVSV